jgi:hypothetical protein
VAKRCSRAYLTKLEVAGAISRLPSGGFDLTAARVGDIRHLRRQRQQSPKSAAEVAFQEAKTRLLQLRIGEREGVLMMTDEAIEVVEELVGLFRTHLSGLAAQCSRDLPTRRAIESAVNAMLHRVADEAARRAEEFGKPSKAATEVPDDDDD